MIGSIFTYLEGTIKNLTGKGDDDGDGEFEHEDGEDVNESVGSNEVNAHDSTGLEMADLDSLKVGDKGKTRRGSGGSVDFDTIQEAIENHVISSPWLKLFVTGIFIGAMEYIPTFAIAGLVQAKFQTIDDYAETHGAWASVGLILMYAVLLSASAAAIVCWLSPAAGGSGLPQLFSFLRAGRVDPEVLSFRTMCVKLLTTTLAVSSGLVIGREGPAIHIGAAAGMVVFRVIERMKGEKKYDGEAAHNAVICGSAAGFATAFRAPLGGMLYVMEELATHWSMHDHEYVGAFTLACVAIATFVIKGLISLVANSSSINFSSIVVFAEGTSIHDGLSYDYVDLPFFILLSVVCGCIAGINTLGSLLIYKWRRQLTWWPSDSFRVADVIVCALITTFLFAVCPYWYYYDCKDIPEEYDDDHRRLSGASSGRDYVAYHCDDGQFSQVASLTIVAPETVLRHMLTREDDPIGSVAIILMVTLYSCCSVLPIGSAVPAGTFVPNMVIGACLGRLCGYFAQYLFPLAVSSPGVYAMMGCGSMLGAWTRTMLAVTVTLCEVTGDVSLALPMAMGVLIARFVASKINHHSLTHALLHLAKLHSDPKDPKYWKDPKPRRIRRRRSASSARKRHNTGDGDDAASGGRGGRRRAGSLDNLGMGKSSNSEETLRGRKNSFQCEHTAKIKSETPTFDDMYTMKHSDEAIVVVDEQSKPSDIKQSQIPVSVDSEGTSSPIKSSHSFIGLPATEPELKGGSTVPFQDHDGDIDHIGIPPTPDGSSSDSTKKSGSKRKPRRQSSKMMDFSSPGTPTIDKKDDVEAGTGNDEDGSSSYESDSDSEGETGSDSDSGMSPKAMERVPSFSFI